MRTENIITRLFCMVDDKLAHVKKRANAELHPSEIVTIGMLFALKGGHFRAFYRWLNGDWRSLFPRLPERTRLQRLLAHYEPLTKEFLVEPTAESVIDTYGIELIHPLREGRSAGQIGQKGKSNKRWMVGVKLCWLVRMDGKVIDWGWDSAEIHDQNFRDIGNAYVELSQILSDAGFRLAGRENAKWTICGRGERNDRMIVERVFSLLTVVNQLKHLFHRTEQHLHARFGYVAAMFNCLLDLAEGKLAIAQFSL
jgi:hypothetical protein